MTSFRASFRYFHPLVYMLGMCVDWDTKWETGLFYLCFWVLCCRKKKSFMRCRSLHCTHKIWGKSRPRSLSSPPPNRDKDIAGKSPLQKERDKKGWVGEWEGSYPMEWKHKCTIQSPYLQTNRKYKHYCIWNQVKTPGGAKFRYCLSYTYIFQQNRSSVKNKGSLKSIIDWFPNDELRLILLPYLIRGCSITFSICIFFYWFYRISTIAHLRSSGWFRINIHMWFYQRLVLKVP